MASGSVFSRLHPVAFASGPTHLGQILSLDLDDGIEIVRLQADGHVDRAASQVMGQMPRFALTTQDLLTALTLAGVDGADIATIVAYEALIKTGGSKSGSADNQSWTLANGFVTPQSLTWQQGGNAILSMRCEGWHGSGTNPLTRATTASLSAPSIDYDERWALKDIKINNTSIASVSDVSIQFNIQTRAQQLDGAVAPSGFTILDRAAVIEFTTFDVDTITALTAISNTTQVRFRKWLNDGTFVADGTTAHITVTAAAGVIVPAGNSGDPRAMRVRIECNRGSSGEDCLALGLGVALS